MKIYKRFKRNVWTGILEDEHGTIVCDFRKLFKRDPAAAEARALALECLSTNAACAEIDLKSTRTDRDLWKGRAGFMAARCNALEATVSSLTRMITEFKGQLCNKTNWVAEADQRWKS